MRKNNWLIAGGMAIALTWSALDAAIMPASAQDDTQAESAEEEDVIIVVGEGRRDRAMAAFQRGDYETAEIEFQKNLECAERIEMLEEFAIDQALSDGINDEYSAWSNQPSRNGGFGGGGGAIYNTPQEVAGFYNRNPRNADEIKERTCEEPAWQLYMIGLSQLQLGKLDEAKESFYRVIALSKNEYLYDAHYRIALLEIMDGNVDKAEKRLEYLKVMQERCRRKGERCEYRAEIDEAVAYLEPTLAKARAEAEAGAAG